MHTPIHIHLITLAHGERLLRLEDDATGLSLERKLQSDKPVVAQKTKLLRLFEAMLQNEHAAA
ncbi:MAG: hypothetical protein JWR15_161 [Prosthecobacter sp.]|nr:hypothetical protein [Prosthecobacter sp.]